MAQRHQAWMVPSESYGLVSLPPNAAVQQQTQAVVGKVAEAMADPLDLVDKQVHGLVGPLEQPLVKKARISASQALTLRASRDSSATPTPSPPQTTTCIKP
jgi:inner membrane protein involved in colicin E2 resistance